MLQKMERFESLRPHSSWPMIRCTVSGEECTVIDLAKVVLASCATALVTLSVSACGGSTTSTMTSTMTSSMSSSMSPTAAAAAAGTLASVCTDIDAIMMGTPDSDPAGTAEKLEAIKARVSTPDADLIENVAAAYAALAANPNDMEAQAKLATSSTALGAGCELATTAPGPN